MLTVGYGGLVTADWSRDASRIAASVPQGSPIGDHLFVYDLGIVNGDLAIVAEHNISLLVPALQANFQNNNVAWANTSDQIAVCGYRQGLDAYLDLWIVDITSVTAPLVRRMTTSSSASEWAPSWSPNDAKVFFTKGGYGICSMSSSAPGAVTVINSKGNSSNRRKF